MKKSLVIQNLKCGGCEQTISNSLGSIMGVSNVSVNHESSTVNFNCSNESTLEKVKEELDGLGYPVMGSANNIGKKAKSYVSCAIGRLNKN